LSLSHFEVEATVEATKNIVHKKAAEHWSNIYDITRSMGSNTLIQHVKGIIYTTFSLFCALLYLATELFCRSYRRDSSKQTLSSVFLQKTVTFYIEKNDTKILSRWPGYLFPQWVTEKRCDPIFPMREK
jgi:hypothetical protein